MSPIEISELREKVSGLTNLFREMEKKAGLAEKEEKSTELEARMNRADFWQSPESDRVITELKEINEERSLFQEVKRRLDDLTVLEEFVSEKEDAKLLAEAEELIRETDQKAQALKRRITFIHPEDRRPAILTFHAGAGGTEACDWVAILVRMFSRFAASQKWGVKIADLLADERAGFKRATLLVTGSFAYGHLRHEEGVHRLVRISPFDSNRRRHTSFASLSVIPQLPPEAAIEIKESDLEIQAFRSSGAGGQNVNKLDTAVRVTHLPSGIVVACQTERSQGQNRENALLILKSKLYRLQEEKRQRREEIKRQEAGEIAWGSQIRSYVFSPYQLIKDHRTGYETGALEAVLNGGLEGFIEAELQSLS
jgi:peptide chain release factor 2